MTGKEEISNFSDRLPTGIEPVTHSGQKSDAFTRPANPRARLKCDGSRKVVSLVDDNTFCDDCIS